MTNNAKAIIIQIIIILFSGVLTVVLNIYLKAKGLEKLASYSVFFLFFLPIGIYILFGKYVYIKGIRITKAVRIGWGLFFILLAPVLWLIKNVILS